MKPLVVVSTSMTNKKDFPCIIKMSYLEDNQTEQYQLIDFTSSFIV